MFYTFFNLLFNSAQVHVLFAAFQGHVNEDTAAITFKTEKVNEDTTANTVPLTLSKPPWLPAVSA